MYKLNLKGIELLTLTQIFQYLYLCNLMVDISNLDYFMKQNSKFEIYKI